MPAYTYAKSLENAHKVNWRIEEVLGDRQFDTARPWLPAQLSGAAALSCLNDEEKLKLTHVELGAYAHIFRFVEEFITPTMVNLAQAVELKEGDAFDALTNFEPYRERRRANDVS